MARLPSPMTEIVASDIETGGGRLRVRDHGGSGRLAVCVPGLSSNASAYDRLGRHLAGAGHHVVSVDLRGRGFSEATPAGTYGWPAHARDVIDVIRALGDGQADLIGHSMGAFVAMAAANVDGAAIARLVLIDALGRPEDAALPPILAGLERLGAVYPSVDDYLGLVRAIGVVDTSGENWDAYYRYDLEAVPGGVRTRTNREAVIEDALWGGEHDPSDLWPALTQPTLLVVAGRPMGDGGFIVRRADRDAFLAVAPRAVAVEVDANHYNVVTDPATAAFVASFLDQPGT